MRFTPRTLSEPEKTPKIGVLLTNLGTPEAPEKAAVRTYLKEFLWDPRVVEIPRPVWWLILNAIVLNVRPKRSAAAYSTIWTQEGSPLMVHTRAQAEAIKEKLTDIYHDNIVVDFAMRYGKPSISSVLNAMLEQGVDRLLVLPLYPQYSCATTASTFDAISQDFMARRALPQLRFIADYHDHPGYIAALAQSVRRHQAQSGAAQKLLLSFHGEPQSYVDQGARYYQQCERTGELLAAELKLAPDAYAITYQSRFGAAKWLQPYTDETLKAWGAEGIKSVQVLCPGFSSDCLETLEEIAMENCEYFLEAGGESFDYIPCLNSDEGHIDALTSLIRDNLSGWPATTS